MNLLDATETLLDAVRTHAPWETDITIARSIKRMEKRLEVLKLRAEKRRQNISETAFFNALGIVGGGAVNVTTAKGTPAILCRNCQTKILFEDFVEVAVFNGAGTMQSMTCPKCKWKLI
jgi:DNA-directed RNA polymerase subunit RPC12/RpoP